MKHVSKPSIIISTYDDIKNPFYGGGGAIAVHEVAKRLLKKYDVTVLSWDYSGKKKETLDTVPYERFGKKSLSPKAAMFAYQMALPLQVMKRKYDVWMESFCPPFTTAMLPRYTAKPVLGIVHMLASEDMERKYKLPFHVLENAGLKQYDNIIVTSDQIKKKVQTVTPNADIQTISNGIEKVYNTRVKREKYVLFLGRIEIDQKGLDLLIPAFKAFNEQKKNSYQLIIAGTGDVKEMTTLKKLIKNAGMTKYTKLVGRVQGNKKTDLIRKAACVVVPSRFETYSLVALEALAHGTPLVCFPIKGLSWIKDTLATKAKKLDSESLTKAIFQVVTDTKISDTKVTAGKAYAKQFTWDEIAKQYAKKIDEVLRVGHTHA